MIKTLAVWLTCLSSLCFAGCQTSVSRQFWDLSVKNGRAPVSRDPLLQHTVALVDPDPSLGQFCSGVVIGKRHILTSAHCFLDKERIPYVYMENNYQPGLSFDERGTMHRIELAVVSTYYQTARVDSYDKQIALARDPKQVPKPTAPLYSLAIALLENDVIFPYKPVVFASGREDLLTSRILAAGYGCKSSCEESDSELHQAEMKYVKTLADVSLMVFTGSSKGTCEGDSGSPLYRSDTQGLSLLAIETTGKESCENGVAVNTAVVPSRSWIEGGLKVLAKPMIQVDGYRVIDFEVSGK